MRFANADTTSAEWIAEAPSIDVQRQGAAEVWPSPISRARSRLPSLDLRRLVARAAHGLWVRVPWLAAGLAVAIPVVNSTIKAVQAGWVPAGDDGIIATRGWDVFTSIRVACRSTQPGSLRA